MQMIKKMSAFLSNTWLLVLIVAAGAYGFFENARHEITQNAKAAARGPFWEALEEDGDTLEVPRVRGIRLHRGVKLSLRNETHDTRYESLALDWDRQESGSFLKITFEENETGAYMLMLGPEAKGGVALARRNAEGKLSVLGRSKEGDLLSGTHKKIRLVLKMQEPNITVEIDGKPVIETDSFQRTEGAFFIEAPKSPCRIYRMAVTGRIDGSADADDTAMMIEDFSKLPRTSYWPQMQIILLQVGLGILGVLLYLRALCLGKPSWSRLVRACLLFLVPVALYFAWGLYKPVAGGYFIPVLLTPLGILLAMVSLRGHVRDAVPSSIPARLGSVAVTLILLAGVIWALGSYQVRFHSIGLNAEEVAQKLPLPDSHERGWIKRLGPHNAHVVDSRFRNLDLTTTFSLQPESLLQIRLRAGSVGKAEGISLFLSSESEFESGFYLETLSEFKRIGDTTIPFIIPNMPLELYLRARGQDFEAIINGKPLAVATEKLFPEGGVVMLAAKGEASFRELMIEPVSIDEQPPTIKPYILGSAACPVAFLMVFVILTFLFTKVPFLKLLEAGAFGLIPLAFCFQNLSPTGIIDAPMVCGTLLLSSLLYLLIPMIHSQRLTIMRYMVLVLLIICGTSWAFVECQERRWPADYESLSRLSLADWSVSPLSEKLVHLQVPALRRWNHYLAKHELRGRSYQNWKPKGSTRILALGTSSTFGYRVKKPYAFRLEEILKADGHNVEVMIGAYQGASGTRVLQFFRNVLLDFRPDIVTLSLFFNDSYALTQHDEAAYLERVTHPYYRRSYMDRLIDQVSMWASGARMRKMMRDFVLDKESLQLETGSDSPPARFKSMLKEYAELAHDNRIRLVLIKEPLAGGKDSLWKEEFYSVIDEVAEEYDLVVVDPTPLLNKRGGADLFRDVVHPYDEGDNVIARVLFPVIKRLLKQKAKPK